MLPGRLRLALSITLALIPHRRPLPQAKPRPRQPRSGSNRAAIETFLKVTESCSMEELKVGVTKPHRAKLPGWPRAGYGVQERAAGRNTGYWESYKSELPPTRWTS